MDTHLRITETEKMENNLSFLVELKKRTELKLLIP